MDFNYFNSRKYIILLVIICILFAILTVKVFDYLPQPPEGVENYQGYTPEAYTKALSTPTEEDYNTSNTSQYEENADEEDDDEGDEEESSEASYDEQHRSGHIDFMPRENTLDFNEIPAPKGADEEEINATN